MHPEIKNAILEVDQAEIALRNVYDRIRPKCKHERIIHSNWRSSEWGSSFKARRLCLVCGVEEAATGIGDEDYHFRVLKTNGWHKVVSSDELYQARFPQTSVDTE